MLGHELTIEQGEIPRLEARDEPRERDLRRIADEAEHAFTEESATQFHAVEAAHQFPV